MEETAQEALSMEEKLKEAVEADGRFGIGAPVAHSALPSSKRPKKRNKSTQKPPGNQPLTPTSSNA
jgi:hypothetical protein